MSEHECPFCRAALTLRRIAVGVAVGGAVACVPTPAYGGPPATAVRASSDAGAPEAAASAAFPDESLIADLVAAYAGPPQGPSTNAESICGVKVPIPEAWTAQRNGDVLVLTPKAVSTLRVAVVRVAELDAVRAVGLAWDAVLPGVEREPVLASHPATPTGWDAVTQLTYDSGGPVARSAEAFRAGNSHCVLLVEGPKNEVDAWSGTVTSFRDSVAGGRPPSP